MKKNLVLVGMMAVGKSTIGKIVSSKCDLDFLDIDKIIEKKNLMTIKEIFEKKGESFFRLQEEESVLLALKKNNCVIALGGGAFINKKIRENILKRAISVWLDADFKILNKRLMYSKKRPLIKKEYDTNKIKELYLERKKVYKLADYKILCNKLSKKTIAKKIINIYEKK